MAYRQPFKGDYPITQRYGELIAGVTYNNEPHTGIDYACPEGTPILASNDGVVVYVDFDKYGFGNMVIIQHNDGKSTVYAHLSKYVAYSHQKVNQGDTIGYSGHTGNTTGSHLHFEARTNWKDYKSHFDPMYLPLINHVDPVTTLKEPKDLHEDVKIVCSDGARAFTENWIPKINGFMCGTKLHFTGKTVKRTGYPYTYCEVYEEPKRYYVAVHDGETQIIDNVS